MTAGLLSDESQESPRPAGGRRSAAVLLATISSGCKRLVEVRQKVADVLNTD